MTSGCLDGDIAVWLLLQMIDGWNINTPQNKASPKYAFNFQADNMPAVKMSFKTMKYQEK
jgi:hypothetical protein